MRALEQINFASWDLAWDLSGELTGTNRFDPQPTNQIAFDHELTFSNAYHPDIFVAFHIDGGAPSGVYDLVDPRDAQVNMPLAQLILDELVKETGLPSRGVQTQERLYSLEKPQNRATYRVLLELGDNVQDVHFLDKPANRQKMANAVVEALRTFVEKRNYPRTDTPPAKAVDEDALVHTDPRIVLAQQGWGPMPSSDWAGFKEYHQPRPSG